MNAAPFKPGSIGAFMAMTPEQRRVSIDKFWDALDRAGGNINAIGETNTDTQSDFNTHVANKEFTAEELRGFDEGKTNV